MYKRLLFILLVALSLSSCKDDPTYRVDSTLNEYLQRFLNEGASRGKNFDLKEQGIIVEFGDLEGDIAGRCYYEDPIRIEIDKAYWDNISKAVNYEELRENLVFHELGHGLLNRRHINDYLPNGDWKSIMCGGTVKDNRSWNINYRSIRKSYYLDELFNQYIAVPYWATKVFADLVTETPVVEDEFNTTGFWPSGNNSGYSASATGGVYSFENKGTNGSYVVRPVALESTADFYIESKFKIVDESIDTQCGIIFGNGDTPVSVNYFTINNNQRMFMGHSYCYGWYTELLKSTLIANDYNTIGIRKIGLEMYYYINGQCVYYDQLSINKNGTVFGFEVAGSSTLLVDYFHIYSNTLRKGLIIDTSIKQPIEVKRTKSIWLNK